MGMGPIDIALWDFAGKHYDAPIHELLGSYRDSFPAYASTYQGTETAASTRQTRTPISLRSVSTWGIRVQDSRLGRRLD